MKNKFIAPGSWFALEYPAGWHEFEDTEETFLFYNPDRWTGNFRISAFKGKDNRYASECMEDELRQIRGSKPARVGAWDCVYSSESFQENGTWYTTHLWVTGKKNISVECSFTVMRGESVRPAEEMIATLYVRQDGDRPFDEVIPARVLEINTVNENFDWAVSTIKRQLTKDFTSSAADIDSIRRVMDSGRFDPKQQQPWLCFGIAFGTILINEIDGMEWVTVVKGKKEYPALRFRDTDLIVRPDEWIWSRVKQGEPCDLNAEFDRIVSEVSALL